MKISDVKGLIGREYTQVFMKDDHDSTLHKSLVEGYNEYEKDGSEVIRRLARLDAYPAQKGYASVNDVIGTILMLWSFSGADVEKYAKILELYIIQFTEFVTKYAEGNNHDS